MPMWASTWGQGWCRRGMYDDGLDAGVMVLMLQFRRRVHRIDIDLCRAGP